jgi:PHD/YefM family antitoxin component YafN of YafNO toxin-antitoxin module
MDEEIMITRNGRIAGVLISPLEFASWKETEEIRKDRALMKEIKIGLKKLKKTKKTFSRKEILKLLS